MTKDTCWVVFSNYWKKYYIYEIRNNERQKAFARSSRGPAGRTHLYNDKFELMICGER